MREMTPIEKYYNKFNEDKRLTRRHGNVEFVTSMKYISEYMEAEDKNSVIDIGAGTGRYSIALAESGYDVTAVELVKYNLGILRSKKSSVKAFQGNAMNLKRFENDSFDAALLFGPMYHLNKFEDRVKCLSEAKRVVKDNGIIFVAYCMNEYSIIKYGFMENHILSCIESNKISKDFKCISDDNELYTYLRLEDIDELNRAADIERIKIISADGPANYMRRELNAMDEKTYSAFIEYHLSTCERPELIGAAAHTVDILRNHK